jgi:exopolyphosphatase/guanosine-5'-triphosphate,3'-diphosphate pyrophosphatase
MGVPTDKQSPISRDGWTAGKHIAAVDMGTNSFHMIIAETTSHGTFRVVDRMKHWVRLGDGVDSHGRLDEAAIERMIGSLHLFKQLADGYGARMHCIATSAMRDAPNRHEIVHRISDELGLAVEVISGEEEARLVFQGVRAEGHIDQATDFVIDIGGGSTEIIAGDQGGVLHAKSLDMGARRFSRNFFANQAYTPRQLRQCRHAAASKIQSVAAGFKSFEVQAVYGTSGTIRKLAEIVTLLHGGDDAMGLSLSDLKSTRAKLIDAVKRDRLPDAIEPERRDTLVAGAIILEEVMEAINARALRVCPSALREGIIYDRIETLGRLPAEPIMASVGSMVKRFNLDRGQIKRVTRTAERIFTAYAPLFGLDDEAHLLLKAACMLHEVGLTISHRRIHLHGGYIIAHANMTGITQRQQQMLSAIVRFHRKAAPTAKHRDLKFMRARDVKTTLALAAILRPATALNRTKHGHAGLLEIEEKKKAWHWLFEPMWHDQHEVCIWNANREKRPLTRLLGKAIQLKKGAHADTTK